MFLSVPSDKVEPLRNAFNGVTGSCSFFKMPRAGKWEGSFSPVVLQRIHHVHSYFGIHKNHKVQRSECRLGTFCEWNGSRFMFKPELTLCILTSSYLETVWSQEEPQCLLTAKSRKERWMHPFFLLSWSRTTGNRGAQQRSRKNTSEDLRRAQESDAPLRCFTAVTQWPFTARDKNPEVSWKSARGHFLPFGLKLASQTALNCLWSHLPWMCKSTSRVTAKGCSSGQNFIKDAQRIRDLGLSRNTSDPPP